jgi:hypothetical protein
MTYILPPLNALRAFERARHASTKFGKRQPKLIKFRVGKILRLIALYKCRNRRQEP